MSAHISAAPTWDFFLYLWNLIWGREGFYEKSVEKIELRLKSDNNTGPRPVGWTPKHVRTVARSTQYFCSSTTAQTGPIFRHSVPELKSFILLTATCRSTKTQRGEKKCFVSTTKMVTRTRDIAMLYVHCSLSVVQSFFYPVISDIWSVTQPSHSQSFCILVHKQLCYHAPLRCQNTVEKSGRAGWGWYRPSRAGVLGLIAARVTWPPRGVCQDPPPTPRKPKKRLAVRAVSHVRGRFFHLKQQTPFLGFRACHSSQTNVSSQ